MFLSAMNRPWIAVLAVAGVLAGCVQPIERKDPLAGTNAAPKPSVFFPQVSLGLVESENTKKASKLLSRAAMWWCPTAILGQKAFDHEQMIRDYGEDVGRAFKSLTPLQQIEDAQVAGVDLVGVLDVYPTIPGERGIGTMRMEVTVVFLDPQGRQVASIKGSASEENPETASPIRPFPGKIFKRVHQEARRSLIKGLDSSRDLLVFANPGSVSAETEPAAAAPRPAPAFHSEVDRPAYKEAENPERFALVVGVEKYAGLPPADFAERDAQAVRDHLLALGVPQRNAILLSGSAATRTGIEKYVESWLPRNVREDSRVFVFFSGHGAPDPKTGKAYLVPWDGDPKFIENTGYPIARLYEKLNALKAKEVVVALDACFSGAGGRSVMAKGMRPLVTQIDEGMRGAGKLVVMTAAGPDEVTGTDEKNGHGLFTYYLLKGLNEKRGKGPVQGIFDYLLPNVQDAARRDNRDQTPQLFGARAAAVRVE